MDFKELAELFHELEQTSSNNKMRDLISSFLKETDARIIDRVAYLLLGQVAAKYEHVNLEMGEKLVLESLASLTKEDVESMFDNKGDLGLVAEELAGEGGGLSVKQVFNKLKSIAEASGEGSQELKVKTLSSLLNRSSSIEARFIPRIVTGQLRIGAGEKTVLEALAIAYAGGSSDKKVLEHGYNICPDIGLIASRVASKGLSSIKRLRVKLGRPIQSMLAHRVKELDTIKEKIPNRIACEEKYDGERVQAHYDDGSVKLFSRRLTDVTAQFPDVVKALEKSVRAGSCVLDGEVVPVDEKGNLGSFQELMKRRRKYRVEEFIEKVPVNYFVFDLLYLNGDSYLSKPYKKRHEALSNALDFRPKGVSKVNRRVCQGVDCVEDFFNWCLSHGAEGIIAKDCSSESVYQPGNRGWLWIKWKPEYQSMADTFDVVVVGAFHGRGKRAGTYGALLCAVYDSVNDLFKTLCKLGSGFSDKQLESLPKKLGDFKTGKKPPRLKVSKQMKPDVWFSPELVVEVKGAEFTKSPSHTADYALRFPRFIRYRPDKRASQATTLKEIKDLISQ